MLVVTGGHDFDRAAFTGLFDALPGIGWTAAEQGDSSEAWDRADLGEIATTPGLHTAIPARVGAALAFTP